MLVIYKMLRSTIHAHMKLVVSDHNFILMLQRCDQCNMCGTENV